MENLDLLYGNVIEKIYINDVYFLEEQTLEYDETAGKKIYYDKDADKDVELNIADFVIIKTDKNLVKISYLEENHFEIVDTIDEDFVDVSRYYQKDVIGKKIKEIISELPDHDVYQFILEDNYYLILDFNSADSLFCAYKPFVENEVDYEKFREKGYLFEKYSLLSDYIKKIKPDFIGKRLDEILRLGLINSNGYGEIAYETDEPVTLIFGDKHLFIDTADDSYMYFGQNICDFTETGYYWPRTVSWRKFPFFNKNFIGQKLKDIKVKKAKNYCDKDAPCYAEYDDKFESIEFVFENNYSLKIWDSHTWMQIQEINGNK